jgi:inorganic pyrophosphatase
LVLARLLGVIEAEQTEEGETKRNDRLMAVPIEAKSGKPAAQTIDHFEPSLAEGIMRFFVVYNEFQGKKFKALRTAGPDHAMEFIIAGLTKAGKKKVRRQHLST